MATSLSGKSIGAPDNAFAWYLQSGGGTLAAGFPVSLGNGSETPLWLYADGIGVWDGRGFVVRDLQAVLASDAVNSTVTEAAIPSFSIALEASCTYEFEAMLLCKSAATTTGIRIALTGPTAQTSFVSYEMTHPTTATLLTTNTRRQWFSAFATHMDNLDAPAADTVFPVWVRGVIKTTASAPAVPLAFALKSEVAASAVTVVAGSILKVRRIA